MADITVDYQYNLSDFNGIVPYSGVRIYPDQHSGDVFVVMGNRVDIYNDHGMETFDFFLEHGTPLDLAVEPGGDILALVTSSLVRCNYRGEFIEAYPLTGLPDEFAGGSYSMMRYRNERFYLADPNTFKVIQVDGHGKFIKGYDLGPGIAAGLTAKERPDAAIGGMDVDGEGSIYVVLSVKGTAAKLSADGHLTFFGNRGSGPGKFGVPSAAAVDRMGYIYICDKLRSVVLVFDKDLKFVTEFGYRGFYPGNLIVPMSVAVGPNDTVYVGQLLDRGVNVYKLSYN